jgi:hypothetical protein
MPETKPSYTDLVHQVMHEVYVTIYTVAGKRACDGKPESTAFYSLRMTSGRCILNNGKDPLASTLYTDRMPSAS